MAVAVLRMRDLFAAVMLFAIYSLVSASLFAVLDAGDVALTEAAVGAGISTILMLVALSLAPRHENEDRGRGRNFTALVVVLVTGASLIYATWDLPRFGEADNPVHQHVAPYYLEESYDDIGIPNVVASVLASYRSIDTLGEVYVVFTAGIGVTMLLGATRRRRRQPIEEPIDRDGDEEGGA